MARTLLKLFNAILGGDQADFVGLPQRNSGRGMCRYLMQRRNLSWADDLGDYFKLLGPTPPK